MQDLEKQGKYIDAAKMYEKSAETESWNKMITFPQISITLVIFSDPGSNMTEKEIKELSKNWTLYNYKVLHFATHGLVVNEVPELSAVVLSQFEEDEGK